jgi:hypothetical protein
MTQAELIALLRDCLTLWGEEGTLAAGDASVLLTTAAGRFEIAAAPVADRPVRWLLHTPARVAAGRPARRHNSISGLLSALRNELGAQVGNRLRVGPIT